MKNLELINGVLCNSAGEKQKLEFGNTEQIAAIKKCEKKMRELNEGLELEPNYEVEVTASVSFRCICGKNVYFSASADDQDDISCFDELQKKCKCKKTYELSVDSGNVICKLIK